MNRENPLLIFSGFPQFTKIESEDILPAINALIERNNTIIEQISVQTSPTWDNFASILIKIEDELTQAWSLVCHLHGVKDSKALRAAYMEALPLITRYASLLGQNRAVYKSYQAIAQSDAFNTYTPEQKKVIKNALRDFKLSGVVLEEDKRKIFLEIQQKLAEASSAFNNNLLDATGAWTHLVHNPDDLQGVPLWALETMKLAAEKKNEHGWMITLEQPVYHAIMTYAYNRALREKVYEAYVTRASELGPAALDNTKIMDEMISLRFQMAELLGFATYAEYSLATKMASSAETVFSFLKELAKRSKPRALQELALLKTFAEKLGITSLEAWDIAYVSEKFIQEHFAVSEEAFRPYFPLDKVLSGLFEIANRLYDISVVSLKDVDVWDETVQVFEMRDASHKICGFLYCDLFSREHKRDGAWMDDGRTRMRLANGDIQYPIAYLVTNFSRPTGDHSALLTHDEVLTLFHEFGHGLHHLLSKQETGALSGTRGVPWDAVELPSQFLEHWAWETEGLKLVSEHYQTKALLPDEMIARLKAAKNCFSGLQFTRQLELALFDFKIHQVFNPERDNSRLIAETIEEVRQEVAVLFPPAYNRFPNSFTHIFAGGYAAGYYSYKWAEVLSCDAFSLFEEKGIFDRQTGLLFSKCILEKGGLFDSNKAFAEFRGREPTLNALLKFYGIE